MLARRCRLCMRRSLCFPCWWVIPVAVHLSDCCTIAALSQRVMFSNRFVKWMKAEDDTNNDALCLPAIRYINVPLITARVYVCESSPKGTDDPVLCSCTDTPIYEPALAVFSFSMSTKFYVNRGVFISLGKMKKTGSLNIIRKSWWPDVYSLQAPHNH